MSPERLLQVEELYHAARERSPEDRAALLAQADPELRREVESLLAQDGASVFDRPPMEVAAKLLEDSNAERLAVGAQLGPYKIESSIGAGGMGEVFRARDTRLNRTVAIKILPSHLDNNAARKRFEREARAVSALNHANICTLHDIGHQDGIDYLVMEYLEGETLAQKLQKGPLPLDQALRYGIEIAGALDQAHRNGVIHRDLKPANIMLTKTGAKVLDFGVAKVRVLEAATGLTQPTTLTEEGAILGTLQYMAPEQLEGKEADGRTDIFAFGAVLYEMVSGRRAFDGTSRADLIAGIIERAPPSLSTVRSSSPSAFDRLIKTCLAKDPEDRWQNARDLKRELQWIEEGLASPQAPPQTSGKRKHTPWMLVTALLGTALILSPLYFHQAPVEIPAVEFNVPLPDDAASFTMDLSMAVSPDGRYLALRAVARDGGDRLWLRRMDSSSVRPLPGTAGVISFFWSPDSRFIGFFSDGKLAKVDIQGGPPVVLSGGPMPAEATWSRSGYILFKPQSRAFVSSSESLYRISDQGGPLEVVTSQVNYELNGTLCFLPDDRRFLFSMRGRDGVASIYLQSLERKEPKLLIRDGSRGLYTRPRGSSQGYILFQRQMLLMAQPFDVDHELMTGEAFAVMPKELSYSQAFSASENGVLAYRAGSRESVLLWVNRHGERIAALPVKGDYRQMSLSPDETTLALTRFDLPVSNVWLIELSRGTITRLTSDRANDWYPIWSPDGRRVVFSSTRDGSFDLYERDATGAGNDEALLRSAAPKSVSSWSRDGRFLAYSVADRRTQNDIWILPLFGNRKPFAFLQTEYNELHPVFSPDGHLVAYTSDESGRQEVYVRSFEGAPAGTGAKWRISTDGGSHPKWRADGKELFYLSPDRKLMSVEIRPGSGINFGLPQSLFQTHVRVRDVLVSYEVAANGQRFLLNTPVEETESAPVTVITNWNPRRH
jgi:serine/threonine protein kinase